MPVERRQHILNQLRVEPGTKGNLAGRDTAWTGGPEFAELSRRLYEELFLTPADDPWLGISTPMIFTGLPGDGVLR